MNRTLRLVAVAGMLCLILGCGKDEKAKSSKQGGEEKVTQHRFTKRKLKLAPKEKINHTKIDSALVNQAENAKKTENNKSQTNQSKPSGVLEHNTQTNDNVINQSKVGDSQTKSTPGKKTLAAAKKTPAKNLAEVIADSASIPQEFGKKPDNPVIKFTTKESVAEYGPNYGALRYKYVEVEATIDSFKYSEQPQLEWEYGSRNKNLRSLIIWARLDKDGDCTCHCLFRFGEPWKYCTKGTRVGIRGFYYGGDKSVLFLSHCELVSKKNKGVPEFTKEDLAKEIEASKDYKSVLLHLPFRCKGKILSVGEPKLPHKRKKLQFVSDSGIPIELTVEHEEWPRVKKGEEIEFVSDSFDVEGEEEKKLTVYKPARIDTIPKK